MSNEGSSFSTPLFTIERIRPEVNLIRFRDGIVLNAALVEESMLVRKEVQDTTPFATITVFPPTSSADADLFRNDLYRNEVPEHFSKAVAMVMEHEKMRAVAERYLTEFPPFFHAKVFDNVDDALVWVDALLAARSRS